MMFMCACVHHVFVLEIDLCGSTARSCAEGKCLLLVLCVSSVQLVCVYQRVCACVRACVCVCACVLLFFAWPAGSSWARVLLGSCVFLCRVSSLSRGFVWVVCMMVAVMEHKHGMWMWGLLLAACVLRCVAKIT